jgi:hypothetical protein
VGIQHVEVHSAQPRSRARRLEGNEASSLKNVQSEVGQGDRRSWWRKSSGAAKLAPSLLVSGLSGEADVYMKGRLCCYHAAKGEGPIYRGLPGARWPLRT